MLVLGIDTSAQPGSVALLREERGALAVVELAPLGAGQPSQTLVPAIAALLERHGIDKRALSLVAVASGPGSFTGLRVALATAKGLAEALSIPVAAVSVLEAIAMGSALPEGASSAEPSRVLAAMDARRGEVFFGEFLVPAGGGLAETLREDIASLDAFATECRAAAAPVRTPDEALAERLGAASVAAEVVERPTAGEIARIGHAKFLAGRCADASNLDANYLRRSEAELVSAARLGLQRGIAPRRG